MTAEKIILLALCLALYAMWVAVALTEHREAQGGGIKPTTREVLRPTSASPPPPKKEEEGGWGIKSNTKTTPATPKAPPPPKKREKGGGMG